MMFNRRHEETKNQSLENETLNKDIHWPFFDEDLVFDHLAQTKSVGNKLPYTINWVLPPMGKGSGGHMDIFRIANFLEHQGHRCRYFIYDASKTFTFDMLEEFRSFYPEVKGKFLINNLSELTEGDITIATSWPTAYPVRSHGAGSLCYFIQDFEPFFEPSGSYSALAENTYKLGLKGITLGCWLKDKLIREYNMQCEAIEFGVDGKEYYIDSAISKRQGIIFYARPSTPRRGFELGLLALENVHKTRPELPIHLFGEDVSNYNIPFPYINHGVLSPIELNNLYNNTVAGLILSFSNISLLPLEMAAAGCMPVVNKAKYTTEVKFKNLLTFADPNPEAIGAALLRTVDKPINASEIKRRHKSALKYDWTVAHRKFEKILKNS